MHDSGIRAVEAKRCQRGSAADLFFDIFQNALETPVPAQHDADGVVFRGALPSKDFTPYSRILPERPEPLHDTDLLAELARRMAIGPAQWGRYQIDAQGIPAAYTYFAQLIAHDLNWSPPRPCETGLRFGPSRLDFASLDAGRLGATSTGAGDDVPRHPCGAPDMQDTRNDQNLTLSQLVVLITKFRDVTNGRISDAREAQRMFRQHLQWITLYDLLPRLMDPKVYKDVLRMQGWPALGAGCGLIPIEFSAAAYRLGHAMVRERYLHWRRGGSGAGLHLLLRFTHHAKESRLIETNGRVCLPDDWTAGWDYLLDGDQADHSMAAAIDENLAAGLFTAPDTLGDCVMAPPPAQPQPNGSINLAEHTLLRGNMLRLPAAQEVLYALNDRLSEAGAALLPRALNAVQLAQTRSPELGAFLQSDEASAIRERTPLWFYMLREADVRASGQHFGPLASRITMETIYRAIWYDKDGILHSDFTPDFPSEKGTFGLKDLYLTVQKYWQPNK